MVSDVAELKKMVWLWSYNWF